MQEPGYRGKIRYKRSLPYSHLGGLRSAVLDPLQGPATRSQRPCSWARANSGHNPYAVLMQAQSMRRNARPTTNGLQHYLLP